MHFERIAYAVPGSTEAGGPDSLATWAAPAARGFAETSCACGTPIGGLLGLTAVWGRAPGMPFFHPQILLRTHVLLVLSGWYNASKVVQIRPDKYKLGGKRPREGASWPTTDRSREVLAGAFI